MNLYLVSIEVRQYDDCALFKNSLIRRVQVISPDEPTAMLTAYSAVRDVYDRRSGLWCCLPICAHLLYTNYKIVD